MDFTLKDLKSAEEHCEITHTNTVKSYRPKHCEITRTKHCEIRSSQTLWNHTYQTLWNQIVPNTVKSHVPWTLWNQIVPNAKLLKSLNLVKDHDGILGGGGNGCSVPLWSVYGFQGVSGPKGGWEKEFLCTPAPVN